MPNLIINRVIRREPVGLAYLKRFIMSMNSPAIAIPALSSMTLNFDASLSSSTYNDSSSLPTTPTCVYMRSHDLSTDKLKKTSTCDSDHFISVPQTSELKSQTTSNDLSKQNSSDNLKDNASNNYCNNTEQQAGQAQQQNGLQLLTKSKKYVKNLAMAADQPVFDSKINSSTAVSSTNGQNVLFTISSSSNLSGGGSDTNREMVIATTSSTIRCQPSLEEEENKSMLVDNQSMELSSEQSDMFLSL